MAVMSFEEAAKIAQASNPLFETEQKEIRGTTFTVFKNVPQTLYELLDLASASQAGKEFLIFGDERYVFEDYVALVNRTAHMLTKLGVKKGDRVAIAMRNYPEYMTLMTAITALGGLVVFVNSWWTGDELEYGFTDSEAKLVFADGPRLKNIAPFADKLGIKMIGVRDASREDGDHIDDLLADVTDDSAPVADIDTDDDFAVMYTSGSTGHPKGVVMTHRGLMSALFSWSMLAPIKALQENGKLPETEEELAAAAEAAAAAPRPCGLILTPMFHVSASHVCYLMAMIGGSKIVMMPKWDAREAVRICRDEEVTRFWGVPTMSAELMTMAQEMGETLPTVQALDSGGAKRPAPQVAKLKKAFPKASIGTGFGMTETNALGLTLTGEDYLKNPGGAGRLIPPLQELKIVDDDDNEVPVGAVGELVTKGPCNMRCYLNKPEATAEALRDGWIYTGDLATIDEDGIVTIVDRKKDMIIRGGENISCLEVDAALHSHPKVAEAAVFSVPDERLGEIVGAGVYLKEGEDLTAGELGEYLAGQLAKFKVPERIWFVDEPLPRGATEKTDRRALRAQCLGDDAAGVVAA